MSLAPATRVGPYEVVAPLGTGGMGEVYHARDTRLGRDVAIKILPAVFSSDPDRLRRFEQEAKAAAALNHPNILAVYDVGTHDGWPYIVSELLDGETLRARASRPLPPRRAIDWALQIAQGLAAAHDKGIVHRDLKPENIITTLTGRAKILDFGLAKLAQPFASTTADGYLPTIAHETQPGVVMGTVGYMSPEQVRGEAADHRSDIFAFGAILYELLAGRRAFSKTSVPETLTSILNDDPPDPPAESGIAPALQRIVDRCLQKNPGARFQSAHDLAFALEQLSATSGSVAIPQASKARSPSWLPWTLFAAAALAAGIAVFALAGGRRSPPGAQTYRFMVEPPGSFSGTASGSFVAVSPDGRRLTFAANRAGGSVLWVQALDSLTAQPLEETEHAYGPFWSPDSRSVGFFAGGKLKRIAATGGPAQTVADVPRISAGATWNQSGTILFATIPGPIQRVADTGGTPVAVTSLESSDPEEMHLFPLFLPDGKRFLFLVRKRNPEDTGIYVKALDSSELRLVARVDSKFAYTQPGYLVYARDGLLMAQPFDAERAVTTGDAIPTSERIEQFPATGNIQMSLSMNGVLAYWGTSQTAVSRLTWMDRRGGVIGTVGEPGPYRNPRLSPDGKRIAVESVDSSSNRDIWLIETSRGTKTRFTFEPGRDAGPVWSPDGSAIAWQATRDLRMRPIRGGKEEILYDEPWIPDDWHASGLLCHPPQPRQIGFLVLGDRNRTMKPAVEGQSITTHGRLSPDGRWLAYTSTESGRFEVDVRSFPSGPVRARVSTDGGVQPKWRADGKELFYLGMDSTLMAVSLNLEEGIPPERPRPLFRTGIPTITGTFWHQYDLSPDGQRFMVNVPVSEASNRVTVVTDWPALFRAQ